jgi:hypothetical protein
VTASGNGNGTALAERAEVSPVKLGRPPVELTDLERARLTALGAVGLNQELTAARLGIAPKTLRRILREDEQAALHWLLGRSEAAERALKLLWKHAEAGQPAAAIFLGKTLAGLRESGPFGDAEGNGAAGGGLTIAFQVVNAGGEVRELKSVTPTAWTSGDDDDDGEDGAA